MTRRGSSLLARLASEHYRTIEKLGAAFVPPSLSRRPRPLKAPRRPSWGDLQPGGVSARDAVSPERL